jgi:hypothetical protein
MDKELLRQRFISAFKSVAYPGDEEIGLIEGRDDSEDLTERLRGRSWESLAPSELSRSDLNFMTPQAFHYYLPAYILAVCEESGDISDAVFEHLTPPKLKTNDRQGRFFQLFQKFTSEQKEVINDFLDFIYTEILEWNGGVEGMKRENVLFWNELRGYWRSL